MQIIAKLVELCAYWGAGCASAWVIYQPKFPKELE